MSGSGVQMPKWKSYTLPSWEQPTILREPPKSIHTRKKERVDMSNVNYMIRNDDTRINEGVSYLQRGINPHIDVMYNNAGGGGGGMTTTMANVQASNPYKVMKDGAFRPPEYRQEDLLPLSRQRRPETSGITNPGLGDGYNIHNLEEMVDKKDISTAVDVRKINYLSTRPTAVFKIDMPTEISVSNSIIKDKTNYSTTSGIKGNTIDYRYSGNPAQATKEGLLTTATSNIGMLGEFSRNDNPDGHQASKNGLLTTTTTNIGMIGEFSRNDNPDGHQASKEGLLTTATSNIGMMGELNRDDNIDNNKFIKDNIILKNISPNFSIILYDPSNKNYSEVFANMKDKINIAVQSSVNKPIDLTREDGTPIKIKDYRWKIVQSAIGKNNLVIQVNNDEIKLDRNLPVYAVGSNTVGHTKIERLHTSDPIMSQKLNTSANTSVSMRYGNKVYDSDVNMTVKGMGSVGSMLNNFGSVPNSYNHDIPTLKQNSQTRMRQEALQNMHGRF